MGTRKLKWPFEFVLIIPTKLVKCQWFPLPIPWNTKTISKQWTITSKLISNHFCTIKIIFSYYSPLSKRHHLLISKIWIWSETWEYIKNMHNHKSPNWISNQMDNFNINKNKHQLLVNVALFIIAHYTIYKNNKWNLQLRRSIHISLWKKHNIYIIKYTPVSSVKVKA
jgi:hypothetical protein